MSYLHDLYMLDVHVANKCNLHCDGCNHWSNYNFSEVFTNNTLEEWATPWSKRLNPERINLLGGEPFLNRECKEIVYTYRKLFPNSINKLFTNAFLLSKQDWLYDCLLETNTALVITFHSRDKRYLKKFKKELEYLKTWGKWTFEKDTWFRNVYNINGVEVEIRDMKNHWYRTYIGNGYNAKPYKDNDKRKSWEECVSKNSIQLYNGLLHKCGPITYLKDFLKKYNLQNDEDWVNYYNYIGLSPNCTDESLKEFLLREEEDICGMCPAHPNKVSDKEIFKLTEN
tara:strand:- start:231 stop:1082 length:852 start_codon:yes stop_codon:yes gene_type:complete